MTSTRISGPLKNCGLALIRLDEDDRRFLMGCTRFDKETNERDNQLPLSVIPGNMRSPTDPIPRILPSRRLRSMRRSPACRAT